jgi:5-hydroxyisourate hydrolase-like protein (transthyretin family)
MSQWQMTGLWFLATILAGFGTGPTLWAAGYDGKLTIEVADEVTGKPIAVRMELKNSRGRPMRVRAKGTVSRDGYIVFDGQIDLELKKGDYRFTVEAGPEYRTRSGHFSIERHAEDVSSVTLRRHVDMRKLGWWAGDLDVRHSSKDLPLLMRAAGIDFAPKLIRENIQGKCQQASIPVEKIFGPRLLLDYRRGGGLLFCDADGTQLPGFDICQSPADASSLPTLEAAYDAGAEVVALTPFAWDLPLWIAADKLTAIQIIHRHQQPNGPAANEGWGRPRDKRLFPSRLGNGRYGEAIYHHLLNCGIRIPPAAGSGSGTNKNPLGTSRVYVEFGDEFSIKKWLAGLRAGQVVVTNGPLLSTSVEGQVPGHVFHLDRGQTRQLQIALSLSFYEKAPVEYLEIVKDGRIEYEVRLDELAKQKGRLPPLEFDDSGWFLVRAMTSNSQFYQFASTGPYYVEANYGSRISRKSVEFFLAWLDQAAEKFAENEAVLADIESARPYWQDLLSRANAE